MMPTLGLKASTSFEQLNERLKYRPSVFEFYTTAADMTQSGLAHLKAMIAYVKATGVRTIVIHHPMAFNHHHNEISVSALADPESYQFMMTSTESLIELAVACNVQVLIHGAYSQTVPNKRELMAARRRVFKRLDYFQALGGNHVMIENSTSPVFDFGDPEIEREVMAHHYRLCYDTSHGFIVLHGNNDQLVRSIRRLAPQTVHYHLVDSMGVTHDSLPLGRGKIDWYRVMGVVNPTASNIYEIDLADQNDCQEMRDSHAYLTQLLTTQQVS